MVTAKLPPPRSLEMFEGLGLGARLAFLRLPSHWSFVPYTGALAYSLMTPIGMAVGLAVRETLSMSSGSGLVASGIIDSISAGEEVSWPMSCLSLLTRSISPLLPCKGILIYNSTVELMAHEFIFNKTFLTCSWSRLWFAVGSFGFGAGIMTLLVSRNLLSPSARSLGDADSQLTPQAKWA